MVGRVRPWLARSAAALALAMPPAWAGEAPVRLPGTVQWNLPPRPGVHQGYEVMMLPPQEEAAPEGRGHALVVLLDGHAMFGAYYDALRGQARSYGNTVLVAVGYPGGQAYDFRRRSYDFSPPARPGDIEARPGLPALGGHDILLDTLEREILPEVARRYPVDSGRRVLVGHSFGGMFALHALYARPALFSQIVSISPSLWWQDRYLLDEERGFVARVRAGEASVRHHRVLLFAGGAEPPQVQEDARALARRLRGDLGDEGLSASYHELPGESHMSMPVAAATRVLRDTLGARR